MVAQVIAENNRLTGQLSTQETNARELQSRVHILEEEVAAAVEKNKVLKMAQSLGAEDSDNAPAKRRIGELVREIDKCIALLNT